MDAKLLTSLIGTGATLGGSLLGMRNQGKGLNEQKREFDTSVDRKNQLLRLALPGMLSNLGYNSKMIPGMMANPSMTPQFAAPQQAPQVPGKSKTGILGLIGGVGGMLLPRMLGR